jgi:hypothetical protein
MVIALVVAVIAGVGGVAYACGGGGSHCKQSWQDPDHNCKPYVDIVWQNPSGVSPSPASVQCTLTLTSSLLTVTAGGLLPGAGCQFHAVLANIGSKTATLTESVSISEPHSCAKFSYSDNVPSSPPNKISSGGTFAFQGQVSLASSAGNTCQGASATISVVVTGTETSSCDDSQSGVFGPVSAVPLWKCD